MGSQAYWEARYGEGDTSGPGSYGRLAEFKAGILNGFVAANSVVSVLELGCGDGHQLSLARYPMYVGADVSLTAVQKCQERFAGDSTKSFVTMSELDQVDHADMVVSLDVLYHLVEDEVFEDYLGTAFRMSDRWVVLYTSDKDLGAPPSLEGHVRHRYIQREVSRLAPDWELVEHIPNAYPYEKGNPETSFADFLVYARVD